MQKKIHHPNSFIHAFFSTYNQAQVHGVLLVTIPAAIGQWQGDTLNNLAGHRRATLTQTTICFTITPTDIIEFAIPLRRPSWIG